jgi:hypothetical protein
MELEIINTMFHNNGKEISSNLRVNMFQIINRVSTVWLLFHHSTTLYRLIRTHSRIRLHQKFDTFQIQILKISFIDLVMDTKGHHDFVPSPTGRD